MGRVLSTVAVIGSAMGFSLRINPIKANRSEVGNVMTKLQKQRNPQSREILLLRIHGAPKANPHQR